MEAIRKKSAGGKSKNILLVSFAVYGLIVWAMMAGNSRKEPSAEFVRLKAACDKVLQVRGITSVSRGYLNAVSSCMADPIGATR